THDDPRESGTEPSFTVECHAGSRAEERPLRFGIPGRRMVEVAEILDRWQEEGARCFRVLDGDGAHWVLGYEASTDTWTVTRA
ncbi:MAG: hypothetical protein ACYTHM_23980, partial [Planctomycetota bacterium]